MSSAFDLYQPGASWLHRLDPRAKLLLAACVSIYLLLSANLWIVLAVLALTHLALWSARIGKERIAWVWKMTLPTMAMISVLWIVVYPTRGPALLAFWFIRIGPDNLARALAVALRIGALAFAAFLWLFTTDQATLVRSLVALGLPYEWGLTVAMAFRYLPTMASAFRMISDAQQARALDLGQGNPLRRARAYTPIIVAMLISALRMAENLSRALESRALGSGRPRTYLHRLHFRKVDLAWTVGILGVMAALVWARYALGLGADPWRILR